MASEKQPDELPLAERYSTERMRQYLGGDLTARDFHQVSGPQMLAMAVWGFQQYDSGRYAEAQAMFETLISLDAKEPYYRIAAGATYLAQEDLEKAEKAFTRAIELSQTEASAYVNRGEVYLRTGRIALAARDFKSAIDLDASKKDPLTQRARLLSAAALDILRKAKAAKEAETRGKPGEPGAPKASAPVAAGKKKPAPGVVGKKK